MANKAKAHNKANHERQMQYLARRVVMLPTKREEAKLKEQA